MRLQRNRLRKWTNHRKFRMRWSGFNWHTDWWPLLMSRVTNPDVEKKGEISSIALRPTAGSGRTILFPWISLAGMTGRRETWPTSGQETLISNRQSSVAHSDMFSTAVHLYSLGLMVKGLMNIIYGHLNIVLFSHSSQNTVRVTWSRTIATTVTEGK